jgi:acetate kinase
MNILTLNAGSSTLKYKLFSMPLETLVFEGKLDHPGVSGIEKAAITAIETCKDFGINAIAHRVVHGASRFSEPVRIRSPS